MGEKAVQFIYPQTRINDKSSSKNRCIVTQRLNPGDLPVNARAAYATTNPLLHPETIDFLSMMNAIGVPVNVAYEIWQYLLLALEDQDFYNTAALIAHYPNLNLIQSNDEIRQGNALYHLVARMIRPYLNAGDLIGLWSGGFDLSQYAASIGCTTLEETPFGFILDSLYLTNSWARLGPLWNVISREFVNVAIMNSAEFHVFIRVYDVNSVLIRQEVNQIRRVAPQLAIFWHPIVSEGPDYLEIDENCNLSENHQACSESECLSRLIYYHHNLYTLGRENATMSANLINEYDLSSMDDALVHLAMV